MNELRKLRMSADFFANSSHIISRCPGVLSVIVYLRELIAKSGHHSAIEQAKALQEPSGNIFLT